MALLFWDASALVKRYMPETGRATVNALFENDPLPEMMGTPWGYLETYSILMPPKWRGYQPAHFCGGCRRASI